CLGRRPWTGRKIAPHSERHVFRGSEAVRRSLPRRPVGWRRRRRWTTAGRPQSGAKTGRVAKANHQRDVEIAARRNHGRGCYLKMSSKLTPTLAAALCCTAVLLAQDRAPANHNAPPGQKTAGDYSSDIVVVHDAQEQALDQARGTEDRIEDQIAHA